MEKAEAYGATKPPHPCWEHSAAVWLGLELEMANKTLLYPLVDEAFLN